MPGWQVISWVVVLALPLTAPATIAIWAATHHRYDPSAGQWTALVLLGASSMYVAFFAWYRGLALGGTVRVSQVQLVQPFLALLFAVPVLGESLRTSTVLFSLAVIATVVVCKRMPTDRVAPVVR
jgi:drug/metabolite transporter (DMT)-like permease